MGIAHELAKVTEGITGTMPQGGISAQIDALAEALGATGTDSAGIASAVQRLDGVIGSGGGGGSLGNAVSINAGNYDDEGVQYVIYGSTAEIDNFSQLDPTKIVFYGAGYNGQSAAPAGLHVYMRLTGIDKTVRSARAGGEAFTDYDYVAPENGWPYIHFVAPESGPVVFIIAN